MHACIGQPTISWGDVPSGELLAGDSPPLLGLGLRPEAGGTGVMPEFPADGIG